MKRLFLCLFSLLLCLSLFCLTGCKKDEEEIPRGFVNATCKDEPFRLYIPSTWNSTVAYGTSGGYYNPSTTSVVRMQVYAKDGETDAKSFYENKIRPAIAAVGQDLKIIKKPTDALLGELNALCCQESALVSGRILQFLTYVGNSSDAFYVLTFTLDDSLTELLLNDENVYGIVKNFKLAEPYGGAEKSTVREPDGKVDLPAGMKLVSSNDVAFRLFVPEDWEFDSRISICEAHNQSGSANLSVAPYLPETSISVAEFVKKQQEQLLAAYGTGFEVLDESETTLGGRAAASVDYRITTDGKIYRVKAISAAYRGMIYTLTYTATEEAYDLFLADAGQAISAFIFR